MTARGVCAMTKEGQSMKWTRWQWGCFLLFSLPAAATAQPLRISVYAPAGTVNKYLSTPGDRAKAAGVMARFQVSKIWLEGRRGDQYVTPELLSAARDDFRTRGLLVSGGFTTVPGKTLACRATRTPRWAASGGSTSRQRKPRPTSPGSSRRTLRSRSEERRVGKECRSRW